MLSKRWTHWEGGGGTAHSPHYAASKNIWRLFDVDKLPGEQKKQISQSHTFSLFPWATKQPQNLFREESRGDRLQVIAPSCEGMDAVGVIGSTVEKRAREKECKEKKNDSECAPPPPVSTAASCLAASETIRPFFFCLYPIKEVRLWNTT